MREISSSVTFEIRVGETVPMKVTRSTRLTLSCGALWVTRSNDTADYWLEPGHVLHLRRGERLWLSVERGPSAQVAFCVPARTGQKVAQWFGRVGERFGLHLRDGWRAV